jgi:hypothetical protein
MRKSVDDAASAVGVGRRSAHRTNVRTPTSTIEKANMRLQPVCTAIRSFEPIVAAAALRRKQPCTE